MFLNRNSKSNEIVRHPLVHVRETTGNTVLVVLSILDNNGFQRSMSEAIIRV